MPIIIVLMNSFKKKIFISNRPFSLPDAKYPFADGGFVLFCHYRYLAVEYLLVAVLSNLSSMRVNENLDINPTHYLDINHADIVARIDLTEWETNPESTRYLTFLKGRVGRKFAC